MDIKNLHLTVRALAKHFTSLTTIVFQHCNDGTHWSDNFDRNPLLTSEEAVREMLKMFRILANKELHFETFDHHNTEKREAAEKILKEISRAPNFITLPRHPS